MVADLRAILVDKIARIKPLEMRIFAEMQAVRSMFRGNSLEIGVEEAGAPSMPEKGGAAKRGPGGKTESPGAAYGFLLAGDPAGD